MLWQLPMALALGWRRGTSLGVEVIRKRILWNGMRFMWGGMAFITAPYEMFTDNGIFIKENSLFDITMLFNCTNNSHGYCPNEAAFEYESMA